MTNLEKWKQELDADKFAELMGCCYCEEYVCPLHGKCNAGPEKDCHQVLKEWANAEAEESEMENEKEETREMKAARISMLRADAELSGILQTERLVETFLRIRIGETHDAVAALREEIQKLKDNVDAKKKNALSEYCRLNGIDTSKWEESDEKDS